MKRIISTFGIAGCFCALVALGGAALAAPVEVSPSSPTASPESITVGPDGSVFFGSVGTPVIYRAKPGAATADMFIDMRGDKSFLLLGVLADAPTNTLWACELLAFDGRTPLQKGVSMLRSFDIQTGAPKGAYPFPDVTNMCNDIAVAADHSVYVTDTSNGRILRLKPGAPALETVIQSASLFGVDGIAFLGDTLYVTTVWSNGLFRVPLDAAGKAGQPVQLYPSRQLQAPDGLRVGNGKLFLAENAGGKVDVVTVDGDKATITTLKDGFGSPTAVQPAGDTLWVGDRRANKAIPLPMPK